MANCNKCVYMNETLSYCQKKEIYIITPTFIFCNEYEPEDNLLNDIDEPAGGILGK